MLPILLKNPAGHRKQMGRTSTVERQHEVFIEHIKFLVVFRPCPLRRFLQTHYNRAVRDKRHAEFWVEDNIHSFAPRMPGNCDLVPKKLVRCGDKDLFYFGRRRELSQKTWRRV